MRKIIIFTCLLFSYGFSIAQQESTIHFMQSISQSRYNNPAFQPRYNTTIGMPFLSSMYISFSNSGFAYRHIINRRIEDDSLEVKLNTFMNRLKDKNYLNLNFQGDILHFGFKINPRIHLMLNVTGKSYERLMYPKDLFSLFIDGNEVNETLSLSPEVEALNYIEAGLGGSFKIDRFWTIGARIKYLKGFMNAYTENSQFDLTTSQDYHITVSGDASIKTSGIDQLEDLQVNGFDDIKDLFSNTGFALDLGATFKPIDKLTIAASVIDIGGIQWKHDLTHYELNKDSAFFTFEGFELEKVLEGEEDAFNDVLDSLTNKLEFQENKIGSYWSPVPAKFYVSGRYEIIPNLYGGLLLFGEKYRHRFHMGVGANITKEVGRRMSVALNYTANNHTYDNLGMGVSFNLSPLQLYFVGDNVLKAPISLLANKELNPYLNSMQVFNLRFGINWVFGWDVGEEKISHDPKLF